MPLTDSKVDIGSVAQHAAETHRPVLLTSQGEGVAVVLSVGDYEKIKEEWAMAWAMLRGMADVAAGRTMTLDEARERLGLSKLDMAQTVKQSSSMG